MLGSHGTNEVKKLFLWWNYNFAPHSNSKIIMKTRSFFAHRVGVLIATLTLATNAALAVSLDYVFKGNFVNGSFLDAVLLDGKDFEVRIRADTTVPDNAPADPELGEFLGPFDAQISIEGMGIFTFVNPIAAITEWIDSPGFQPVESKAKFGGASTSSMTGFSPDALSPFFGDPNLLDPFPGGANVVVADFNDEPMRALGSMLEQSLNGQSPGGSVFAQAVPESGSAFLLLGLVVAGFVAWPRARFLNEQGSGPTLAWGFPRRRGKPSR